MRNPKDLIETLIKDMESRLDEIVAVEGYQEMADGFNQALVMVKEFNGSFDFMTLGGGEIRTRPPLESLPSDHIGTWQNEFYYIVEEFRQGKYNVKDWNFCIQEENGKFTAYIMGEGAEQCLARQANFVHKSTIEDLFYSLGVKHIRPGVG